MTRFLISFAFLVSFEVIASAQGTPNDIPISSFDPEEAVAPVSSVEGRGIKIGEGTVLHPTVGLETGVVSNVFYTPGDTTAAGLLRLLVQVGTGSFSGERMQAPGEPDSGGGGGGTVSTGALTYSAALRASYDQMLSGNETVRATGGLGLGALFRSTINPAGKVSLGIDENFTRLIRAANFETDADTNRDINLLGLNVNFKPDSAFGGFAYYLNAIDVFERSTQRFADRMENKIGVHPTWHWLPNTQVYLDLSQGYYTGIGGSSKKVSSFPFEAVAGLATLLTLRTTLNVNAGYTLGNYATGPSYSGFVASAQFGYRYSPLGRVLVAYDLQYSDSINANYYRDHVIRLWLQQLYNPLTFMIQPEVHFREYQGITLVTGPPTRDDVIFSVIAGVHYNFRSSIAATLNYHYSQVMTDYRYMVSTASIDPSFARHELLLGVRVAL
jgi:hypothetical protein